MSLESPLMVRGYLHQVLVNGATPFRYRSGVRSLLGMPDSNATVVPGAASLPPVEFLYAIPRSYREEFQIAESSKENDRLRPLRDEPNTQIEQQVPPPLTAPQLGRRNPESSPQKPLNVLPELPILSPMAEIAPLTALKMPVREIRADFPEGDQATAITIPGITDPLLSSNDFTLPLPEFHQMTFDQGRAHQAIDSNQTMDSKPTPESNRASQPENVDFSSRQPRPRNPDFSAPAAKSLRQPSLPPQSSHSSAASRASVPEKSQTTNPILAENLPIAFSDQVKSPVPSNLIWKGLGVPQSEENHYSQDMPRTLARIIPDPHLPMVSMPMPVVSESYIPDRREIADHPTAKVTEELTRLRSVVADLTAQVTAQQDIRHPAVILPAPAPIIERSVLPAKSPQAFWERSYVSRLYRWARN